MDVAGHVFRKLDQCDQRRQKGHSAAINLGHNIVYYTPYIMCLSITIFSRIIAFIIDYSMHAVEYVLTHNEFAINTYM